MFLSIAIAYASPKYSSSIAEFIKSLLSSVTRTSVSAVIIMKRRLIARMVFVYFTSRMCYQNRDISARQLPRQPPSSQKLCRLCLAICFPSIIRFTILAPHVRQSSSISNGVVNEYLEVDLIELDIRHLIAKTTHIHDLSARCYNSLLNEQVC